MKILKYNTHRWQNRTLLGAIILISILMILLTACEPFAPMKIRNETSETLSILVNNNEIGKVLSHNAIENKSVIARPPLEWTIVAKDSQGNTVFQEKYTYDELKWLDGKVLIPSSRIPK